MPKLEAVTGPSGAITDVTISYPRDLDQADARVFSRDAAAAAVNVFVPHAGRPDDRTA